MKVLITGGGGFLGSLLTERLLKDGYQVTVLDNLFRGQVDFLAHLCDKYDNFEFVYGSINDDEIIKKIVPRQDVILHLASLVGEPICKKEPKLATIVNVEGTKNIVKYKNKDTILFYSGTGSSYGDIGDYCDENTIPKPVSHYAKTKLEAEKICLDVDNSFVYRFSTAYGNSGNMRVNLLINNLVHDAIHRKNLVIMQADHKRSFVHTSDIVDAILFGIYNFNGLEHKLYNVGHEDSNWTKRMVAEYLKGRLGCAVFYADEGYKDADVRDYFVSFKRINSEGWKAKVNMQTGIENLIKSAKIINIRHQYL